MVGGCISIFICLLFFILKFELFLIKKIWLPNFSFNLISKKDHFMVNQENQVGHVQIDLCNMTKWSN
jgi:hypothetical protein